MCSEEEGAIRGFIQERETGGSEAGLKTGAKTRPRAHGKPSTSTVPCAQRAEHTQTHSPRAHSSPKLPQAAPALLSPGTGPRCCTTGAGSSEKAHA